MKTKNFNIIRDMQIDCDEILSLLCFLIDNK